MRLAASRGCTPSVSAGKKGTLADTDLIILFCICEKQRIDSFAMLVRRDRRRWDSPYSDCSQSRTARELPRNSRGRKGIRLTAIACNRVQLEMRRAASRGCTPSVSAGKKGTLADTDLIIPFCICEKQCIDSFAMLVRRDRRRWDSPYSDCLQSRAARELLRNSRGRIPSVSASKKGTLADTFFAGGDGGIRTLEPTRGYLISSQARYDRFDTSPKRNTNYSGIFEKKQAFAMRRRYF